MSIDQGASLDMSSVAVASFATSAADHSSLLLPLSLGDAGAPGRIVSLTPADGTQLSADAEVARFTPIQATIDVRGDESPLVYAVIGSMWWLVFDGTNLPAIGATVDSTVQANGFAPFMREHSTVRRTDTSRYVFSIIPNGGWWRSGFRLEFVSGAILTQ